MSSVISRSEILENRCRNSPMILVEALPYQYYADVHLPGAININHDEVEQLAPKVLPDKKALVVVYCSNKSCNNSTLAAQTLERMGYANVRKYSEGKQDWIAAGLPTGT